MILTDPVDEGSTRTVAMGSTGDGECKVDNPDMERNDGEARAPKFRPVVPRVRPPPMVRRAKLPNRPAKEVVARRQPNKDAPSAE